MIAEDEDDTHICLKCHTTITGLDNYVSHRKAGCGGPAPTHDKPRTLSPLMPPLPPDEPDFSLKADDFFSLLELQSSSKKQNLQVPSGGKTPGGVLTRSKATAVIQASNVSREGYCVTEKRASDWLGGHHLRELGNVDNQTKLINAVHRIGENHIKKDELAQISYDELEDDSNDEYEDDDEDDEDDCHGPPRSHTGGKWKPTSSPIQWVRPSSSNSTHECNEWESPPPSHTGGKWKPTPPSRLYEPEQEKSDDEDKHAPPPDHTKGKWIPTIGGTPGVEISDIPPLRKSSGTVQYWCGPCNRRLASKVVYERHLRSDLHLKRTLHEREFDESVGYMDKGGKKREEGKRKVQKRTRWLEHEDVQEKVKNDVVTPRKTRRRATKRTFIRCEVCRSRVLTHLIGKHLISHYHCRRRAGSAAPLAQQMVLDNILGVVQQAPFQCAVCRFFCNTHTDFLRHWRSAEHRETARSSESGGVFACSFCKYECERTGDMERHLLTDAHREVISVINRSVPIIIRRISAISCATCHIHFRLNVELRRHCSREGHEPAATGTDIYQERHPCSECPRAFRSHASLQRHMQRRHGKKHFFCSLCSLTFNTFSEAKLHRKTPQHKAATSWKSTSGKEVNRACKYCFFKVRSVAELKEHLRNDHPEHAHICPKCGQRFTLPQEVSRHIRDKQCSFDSSSSSYLRCGECPYRTSSESDLMFHEALHSEPLSYDLEGSTVDKGKRFKYKCPVCNEWFRKVSLRYHLRLHTNERPHVCELCKAAYTRNSNLLDHIKARHPEAYDFGKKTPEKTPSPKSKKPKTEIITQFENNQNKFLCSYCGKKFLKKFTLQQHLTVHTGKEVKCPHEGCVFSARSAADLRPHLVTHSEVRPFSCHRCDYSAKTKPQLARHERIHGGEDTKTYSCTHCAFTTRLSSHLKRHIRVHTGAKPYSCPYCNYTSSNLENLRKHILLTTKHEGKSIYECKFCEDPDEYATNFAKDFRVHLHQVHPEKFNSVREAASYVLGIYNANDDPCPLPSPKKTISKPSTSKKQKPTTEKSSEADPQVAHASNMPSLHTPVRPAVLLTSAANQEPHCILRPIDNELMSMVVVSNPKDEVVYMMPSAGSDAWTMEGYYDVEESGNLVPFDESFDSDST